MKKTSYATWYEFKKDLQKRVGHSVLNQEWLQVKPQKPLPWNAPCMYGACSRLLKLEAKKASRN